MTRDNNLVGFVIASLLLHGAALAWLDFSGAGPGRLPSRLSVLLEKGDAGQGVQATGATAPAPPRPDRDHADVVAKAPPADLDTRAPEQNEAGSEPAPQTSAKAQEKSRLAGATPDAKPAESRPATAAPVASAPVAETFPVAAEPESESAPAGAPLRTAAAAAAAGKASTSAAETAPAGHGELLSLLHQAISREQRYPSLALRQRREGTATVSFNLSPRGDMDAIEVDRSSGFSVLDGAAVSAVSRVAPFAPARTYLSDVTRFRVDVTFRLMN